MDSKTERILTKDTLAEAERTFGGKHWSQFNNMENSIALFNIMHDNEDKATHLKSINDTYFGMTWDEFKDLINERGFINAYTYEFEYHGHDTPTKEEAIIYYHPEKGLVIWAQSFSDKTSVNGGTLYGEIQANNKEDEKIIWKWLSSGSCINIDKKVYETSHDVREGLFSKLDTLESAGKFLNRWTGKNRFMWFVDYVEDDEPEYDYKKITQEKIAKCPKELQEIIGR